MAGGPDAGPGDNQPPVEVRRDDAELLLAIVERDMGQGLALLTMKGISEDGQRKVVEMIEQIRPVRDRLRNALAG